jgi:hypothetical protein
MTWQTCCLRQETSRSKRGIETYVDVDAVNVSISFLQTGIAHRNQPNEEYGSGRATTSAL